MTLNNLDKTQTDIENALVTISGNKPNPLKKINWMTDEILEPMKERRLQKNKDHSKYKKVHKMIQRKIKEKRNCGQRMNVKRLKIQRIDQTNRFKSQNIDNESDSG